MLTSLLVAAAAALTPADSLWQAHVGALAADSSILPLDSAGVWHLPASLEPHADMKYTFTTYGQKPAKGWPLLIYLHGSGPREREFATGQALTRQWAEANGASVWFVPRIPNEGEYYRWWQKAKLHAWDSLLRRALADPDIDPDRIYMLGISEGGYGSQRLASFYADYLAAAGPMAGGEPLVNAPADNLRNTPFSLLTGSEDRGFYRNILTERTGLMLDSLAAANPGDYEHRVELQPGRGHGIDYSPTAPWLLRHVRRQSPRRVTWEDYPMDGVRRRAFANIEPLTQPAGDERVRYDVVIDSAACAIKLTVDTVTYRTVEADPHWGIALRSARTFTPAKHGVVRIYLDDKMIDTRRKITVYVNGRKKRIKPQRGEQVMARSIELWGDPRRIYPASLLVKW